MGRPVDPLAAPAHAVGWVERMRPFTENDVAPLLLAVVAVAVVVTLAPAAGSCAAGLALFRHRDVHRDELEAGTRRCECPRPGNEM